MEWEHIPLPDRSWEAQDASLRLLQSVAERYASFIVGLQWIDQSLLVQFNDNRTEAPSVFNHALHYILEVVYRSAIVAPPLGGASPHLPVRGGLGWGGITSVELRAVVAQLFSMPPLFLIRGGTWSSEHCLPSRHNTYAHFQPSECCEVGCPFTAIAAMWKVLGACCHQQTSLSRSVTGEVARS